MDKIAVVNFGCQYTHLIGMGVRRLGVYSEILPNDVPFESLGDYKGIVLSGGPRSVYEDGSPRCDPRLFGGDIPVLGICYGFQLMAHEMRGIVGKRNQGEYGEGMIKVIRRSPLLEGLDEIERVWMSHGDSVISMPGFRPLAFSDNDILAAAANEERGLYGLQFHPEVSHTPKGRQILGNFVLGICEAKPEWTAGRYIDLSVERIREQVGDGHAKVFASGGVDSTVAAALATRAIGDRATAVHIDNGFERKGEAERVREMLKEAGISVQVLDKADFTLRRVGRSLDPETKRHIVGNSYIEALYDEFPGFQDDSKAFLVQGTIYPDSVESGEGVGNQAALIKSHHNVAAGKVKELKARGRIVEPNIDLYKHEVREVARELDLPEATSKRHPFPGPGLSVRYVGRILKARNHEQTCLRASEILGNHSMDGVVVPIGTVGVKGSHRDYGNLVLIEAERERYDDAREASNKLGNWIPGITRAALVLDGESHGQEDWNGISRMQITRERLSLLREADHIAMRNVRKFGIYDNISQMPVILFPGPGKRPWIALRPVVTPDFMTLRPPEIPKEMGWDYFEETAGEIRGLGVGGVVLDTTNKPPATTEWE